MLFKPYFLSIPVAEREAFACRCGTSVAHLRNIAYGKTCGEALAIAIDRESSGRVPVEDLRPDVDWSYLRGTAKPCPSQASA
jgi:DNA-binding transcriptional regulator YdaS (Cro superfamily)